MDQQRMRIAFTAKVLMGFTGDIGRYMADSVALMADALDMLADASAYAVAWLASNRSIQFQQRAARLSAALLIILGMGVLVEAGNRQGRCPGFHTFCNVLPGDRMSPYVVSYGNRRYIL